MLALLEDLLPMMWIAAAVGISILAARLRSRLPVALGLCAVSPLGFVCLQMFC